MTVEGLLFWKFLPGLLELFNGDRDVASVMGMLKSMVELTARDTRGDPIGYVVEVSRPDYLRFAGVKRSGVERAHSVLQGEVRELAGYDPRYGNRRPIWKVSRVDPSRIFIRVLSTPEDSARLERRRGFGPGRSYLVFVYLGYLNEQLDRIAKKKPMTPAEKLRARLKARGIELDERLILHPTQAAKLGVESAQLRPWSDANQVVPHTVSGVAQPGLRVESPNNGPCQGVETAVAQPVPLHISENKDRQDNNKNPDCASSLEDRVVECERADVVVVLERFGIRSPAVHRQLLGLVGPEFLKELCSYLTAGHGHVRENEAGFIIEACRRQSEGSWVWPTSWRAEKHKLEREASLQEKKRQAALFGLVPAESRQQREKQLLAYFSGLTAEEQAERWLAAEDLYADIYPDNYRSAWRYTPEPKRENLLRPILYGLLLKEMGLKP